MIDIDKLAKEANTRVRIFISNEIESFEQDLETAFKKLRSDDLARWEALRNDLGVTMVV